MVEAATGALGGASGAAAALVSAAAFLGQMYIQRTIAAQDAKQAAELESMRADLQQGLSEFQANAAVANRRRMKARTRARKRARSRAGAGAHNCVFVRALTGAPRRAALSALFPSFVFRWSLWKS
jgi:hypothetical protein